MEKKLNPKQEAFCSEFPIDHNGTQAAIRAGYSKKTANVKAAQLLALVNIQERIQHYADKALKRNDITVDRILQEIANIAFIDPQEFFTEYGTLRNIHSMEESARRAISQITVKEERIGSGDNQEVYEIKTIKPNDKLRALELLGKYKKLFTDKIEHTGEGGGPIKTENKWTLEFKDAKDES